MEGRRAEDTVEVTGSGPDGYEVLPTVDFAQRIRGNRRIELEAKAESATETVITWGAEAQLTVLREKTKKTLFKGKHSAMRSTMNGSGSGEGCIQEAQLSLEDFLGIGLLDSTEDLQGHGGVCADLRMRGVAASDIGVLLIDLLVRERVGCY